MYKITKKGLFFLPFLSRLQKIKLNGIYRDSTEKDIKISIDLKAALDIETLDARLLKDFEQWKTEDAALAQEFTRDRMPNEYTQDMMGNLLDIYMQIL